MGSHPVASSLGRLDNEDLSLEEMLAQVSLITGSVDVPVSVDLESGYGASPVRLVEGLLGAGAVGLNLEDTVHGEEGRLRTEAEHAELIGGLREAAERSGVHVVLNARTDIMLRQIGPAEDRLDRSIARLRRMAEAGADVLYPVGVSDDEVLRRLTTELPLPINAIGRPDVDDYGRFAHLGVARVSFGPFLQRALGDAAAQLLARWRPHL